MGQQTVNAPYFEVDPTKRSGGKRTPKSLAIPTTIAVVQEGSYFGGVETLRGMSPMNVSRIEFLDGPAAAAVIRLTNGQHVEAAIVLEFSR